MKTVDWIGLLARNAGPVPRHLAWRRILPALCGGAGLALLLTLVTIGSVGVAPFATAVPWMKFAFAAALGGPALLWLWRLSRPGADPGHLPRGLLLGAGTIVLMGAVALVATASGERANVLLGSSWAVCPRNILLLSLPALAGLIWALRGLAPTQPRRAGLAAGLVAGAVSAWAYAFSCPEPSAAFVAVWYSAGVLCAGALGWVLGPRLLRW